MSLFPKNIEAKFRQLLPAKIPAIPSAPTSTDPQLRQVLEAIITTINTREGSIAASPLDTNVTRRDLESLGFDSNIIDSPSSTYKFTTSVSTSGGSGGTGYTTGGVGAPGSITDLTLIRRVSSNILSWVNPTDTHSDITNVEIWHSNTPELRLATLIGIVTFPTATFVHTGITYGRIDYYWLRVVSTISNTASNYTSVSASADVGETINRLLDDLMDSGDKFQDEIRFVANAFSVVQPSALVKTWEDKNYMEGDIVKYLDLYYYARAKITAPTNPPNINSDWANFNIALLPSSTQVFRIGVLDGIPTIGIRGDMIVDGSILARHIGAGQIDGEHINASSQIFLDTGGTLRIGGNDGGEQDPGLWYDGLGNFYVVGSFTFTDPSDIRTKLNVQDGADVTENTIFATTVLDAISNIQDQLDGVIDSWFYAYDPTTSNAPYTDWLDPDVRADHLGDLFYNTSSGDAFRFQKVGLVYSWLALADTGVAGALAAAAAAQDTADHKRRVFVDVPYVPYDIGDLWDDLGMLKRCKTAKLITDTYSPTDWQTSATIGAPNGTFVGGIEAAVLIAQASTATSDAQTAKDNAAIAIAEIGKFANDNVLTPGEKSPIVNDFAVIYSERPGILAQADAYGIITKRTSYDNAVTALKNYLDTLASPVAWTNLSSYTDINGATLRDSFALVYTTKQTLLNKIASVAGTRATWSEVSGTGKPADNATVGATWGTNLANLPTRFGDTVSVAGLYVTANYLGYYNSGWKSWIGSNGQFYFTGGTGQYLAFNGTDLEFTGKLNVKSSTSGARLEITNQVIKVYDANNVLRVKLGDLSA